MKPTQVLLKTDDPEIASMLDDLGYYTTIGEFSSTTCPCIIIFTSKNLAPGEITASPQDIPDRLKPYSKQPMIALSNVPAWNSKHLKQIIDQQMALANK